MFHSYNLNSTVVTTEVKCSILYHFVLIYLNSTVVTTEGYSKYSCLLYLQNLNSTVVTTEENGTSTSIDVSHIFKFYCSNN